MNNLQIEYFLSLSETLSFTKTAIEKFVSQPAVSKQIAAMEHDLGVELFERSYKSIKLTDAGKLFADFYRKQRKDLDLLTNQVKDRSKRKHINLRVGCGSGWNMTDFMPQTISRVAAVDPDVKIILESHSFNHLPIALNEEAVDVIITLDVGLFSSPHLEIRPLTEIRRVIIYSECHHLATRNNLEPSDFSNEVFFIPVQDEAVHIVELVKSFCEPYGFTPRIQGVRNTESLIMCVLNGLGVAITDAWTVQSNMRKLCHIPLNTNHGVSIAWRRKSENTALPIFLRELTKEFDDAHSVS